MTDKKAPNYTKEQTLGMVLDYETATNDAERKMAVEEIAANLGKTVRSVRQKLVREGVYQSPTKKTKAGTSVERKSQIVEDIADTLGVEADVIGSLEAATKPTLELIRAEFMAAKALLAGEGSKPDSE